MGGLWFYRGELTCFVVLGMDLQENTEGLSLGGQNIIQPKKKLYNQRVLESLDLTERHSRWKSFWEIVQIVRKRLQRKSDWLGKIPNYFWLLCCQKKSIGTYFLVSTVSFFFQISFWRERPNYHFSAPLWRSQRTTKGDTCPKVKLLLGPGQMFYGHPCWSK